MRKKWGRALCVSGARLVPAGVKRRGMTQEKGVRWDLMTAAGSLYIIPMLIIVIFFQKSIVRGMTLGAVKG